MGLMDLFSSTPEPKPEDFAAVEAAADPAFVDAPVSGAVIERQDVESGIFAEGLLGKGCGIQPQEDVLYAPVTGTVTVTFAGSRHAIGFVGEGGAQVIVHVGLGTVKMEGKGFTYLVEQGASVTAGQPVLAFSRDLIKEAGYDPIVTVAVANAEELGSVALVAHGHVDAGEKLLQVLPQA